MAEIIQGDLAKIGVAATIALKDPTTLVNDAIIGNFDANVYACSVGVPNVQDFEDCSVYRPNKGPFAGPKTLPGLQAGLLCRCRDRRSAAAHRRVQARVRGAARDAWAVPICMRGLLCGQSAAISGVAYDAKTHLVYQGIVKS